MTSSSNRLDRIEALLGNLAERQDRFQEQQDRFQEQQDRFQEQQERTQEQLQATRAICDSNARSIESLANQQSEDRDEEFMTGYDLHTNVSELRQDVRDGFGGVHDDIQAVVRVFAEDLATQREEYSQWFNNLLADARADRQEAARRFDEQMGRMDERAAANEAEHNAFRQNIQVLLAEIARLWQRLAG